MGYDTTCLRFSPILRRVPNRPSKIDSISMEFFFVHIEQRGLSSTSQATLSTDTTSQRDLQQLSEWLLQHFYGEWCLFAPTFAFSSFLLFISNPFLHYSRQQHMNHLNFRRHLYLMVLPLANCTVMCFYITNIRYASNWTYSRRNPRIDKQRLARAGTLIINIFLSQKATRFFQFLFSSLGQSFSPLGLFFFFYFYFIFSFVSQKPHKLALFSSLYIFVYHIGCL
jgi:hypothetical protein